MTCIHPKFNLSQMNKLSSPYKAGRVGMRIAPCRLAREPRWSFRSLSTDWEHVNDVAHWFPSSGSFPQLPESCRSPSAFSFPCLLCRSRLIGFLLSFRRNCCKCGCALDVFLGGDELSGQLCHNLGPARDSS